MLFFGDGWHNLIWSLNDFLIWMPYIVLSQWSSGNYHRYRNWHLHSPAISWYTVAISKICFNPSIISAVLLYSSTKIKLNKSASSLALGLAKRLASSCNLNALVLVNIIKCLRTKVASISLIFTGQINIRTRVNSRCVGT